MRELRLIGVSEEGTHLLLADRASEEASYRIPLDERLRAAIRGDAVRLGQLEIQMESTVRPKDIQARIRAGQTPEDVAEAAGVPVAKIEAFAVPVIRERTHIAEMAQQTTVRNPGESQPGPTLGDSVERRLTARGVDPDDMEWDAWKREDGTWKVRLHYELAGRTGTAEWIYDVSARHVRPVDDDAAALASSTSSEPAHDPEPAEEVVQRPFLAAVGSEDEHPTAPLTDDRSAPDTGREPLRIARQSAKQAKRSSVPSWDEIIFGTRRRKD